MAYQPEIEKLQQRYEADPSRNFAQLAEAYRREGKLDDALQLLRTHLEERPKYVSGLIVLGRCLLDNLDDREARETFERVLAVDPEHIIALKSLADIAERGGQVADARKWLERLLEVDPMNNAAQQALRRLGEAGAPAVAEAESAASEPDLAAAEPAAAGEVAGFEPTMVELAIESAPAAEETVAAEAGEEPTAEIERVEPVELTPTVIEAPAVDVGEAPAALGDEFEIERASAEYDVVAADIEAIEVEQSAEAALPPTVEIPAASTDEAAEGGAEEEAETTPESSEAEQEPLDVGVDPADLQPFDSTLGWGTGERTSGQITADDIAEAERMHEAVEPPAHELPGLEEAEIPDLAAGGAELAAPVEPLETVELEPPAETEPVAGLAPTSIVEAEEIGVAEPGEAGPAEVPEPVAEAAEAGGDEAAAESPRESSDSLAGLPVFLPDAGGEELREGAAEPEPVVTETMAEVYAKQGLLAEAKQVYRTLLEGRPGDARLEARLAELERESAGGAVEEPRAKYAASVTGGESARAYLTSILAARPAPAAVELPGAGAGVGAGAGAGAGAPAESASERPPSAATDEPATPMDEAFEGEPPEPRGAPTVPAAD
ncbi:MAG: hypothetical protein IH965_14435, partial [Gemmatimonadetes bacterium]|nr:hypothetical protein [Gemmatimonadota bacterium]